MSSMMSGMMGGGGGGGGGMQGPGAAAGKGGGGTANMFGFEVPSLSKNAAAGFEAGNQAMLSATQQGNQPNYSNQAGSGSAPDVASLIKALGGDGSQNSELNGKSFDNPTGMTNPDFNNPMGKRKDLNLGSQSKTLDTINWDNLKL